MLETDRDEVRVETNTDADVLVEEALPRVTEPEIPDEERTKPEGIKLCDEERFPEAEHADT